MSVNDDKFQELAKEFASVPIQYANSRCERGQSYYCNDKAGNAAYIDLMDIDKALRNTREVMSARFKLKNMILKREDFRDKIYRAIF